MSTMKKFIIYFILFLLFFGFVNLISKFSLQKAFIPIEEYSIEFTKPSIEIKEAKRTKVNGYISGIVKNETNEMISSKYIKIDYISENNNIIASKYIEIYGINPGEEKKFKIEHRAENIKTFKMTLSDQAEFSKDTFLEKIQGFIDKNFRK